MSYPEYRRGVYHNYEDELPSEPIMICDYCSELIECCECPKCTHCGENDLKTIIVQIKCPVIKCEDEGDKICISCKNIHDQRHSL